MFARRCMRFERQPGMTSIRRTHCWQRSRRVTDHGPLAMYVKLRIAHALGMPGTFSPPPRVSDPDMHYSTCVTHVPGCMSGSLTNGFLCIRWRGKRSRHSRRMRNPQFYVSGKRPMQLQILVLYFCDAFNAFYFFASRRVSSFLCGHSTSGAKLMEGLDAHMHVPAHQRHQGLTHCVLVLPYGVDEIGHNWSRKWFHAGSAPTHYLNVCYHIIIDTKE